MKEILPLDPRLRAFSGPLGVKKTCNLMTKMIKESGFKNNNPKTKKKIIQAKKNLTNYLNHARVFISDENEIRGFKRLAIFGTNIFSYPHYDAHYIGIKDNGKFNHGSIEKNTKNRSTTQINNVAELLPKTHLNQWNFIRTHIMDFRIDNYESGFFKAPDFMKNFPTYYSQNRRLSSLLDNINIDKLKQAYKMIIDMVNPDILEILNKAGMKYSEHLEWILGGSGEDSEECIQARQQAVKAYPLFAHEMKENPDFHHLIQERSPLIEGIAKIYKAEKKRIKLLRGCEGFKDKKESDSLIKDLIILPDTLFPKHRESLKEDMLTMKSYAKCIYQQTTREVLYSLSKTGDPWRYIEKMKEIPASDVNDAFIFLNNKLFLPAFLQKIRHHAQRNEMEWKEMRKRKFLYIIHDVSLERIGLKHIIEFSKRYHRNIFRYEDRLNDETYRITMKWNPMIGTIDFGDGYMIRELHSEIDLKSQGIDQNHCVGGYTFTILSGLDQSDNRNAAKLIFSLEKNGIIKSTMDIECEKIGEGDSSRLKFSLIQNRASNNMPPSAEEEKIADRFVKRLHTYPVDVFHSYLENLEKSDRVMNIEKIDDLYLSSHFNPFDRDFLAKVWDELKIALPPKIRHLGLDGFIDSMPIEGQIFTKPNKNTINIWDKVNQYYEFIRVEKEIIENIEASELNI